MVSKSLHVHQTVEVVSNGEILALPPLYIQIGRLKKQLHEGEGEGSSEIELRDDRERHKNEQFLAGI